MRIGIMLRHYDQQEGGVKVYTRTLLPLLFSLGAEHQYTLIYKHRQLLGTYAAYRNVEETVVPIPGSVLWDQLAGAFIARSKRLDLIFNPKFTVPFCTRAKTVFVLHGSEWFEIPEYFRWYDQIYTRIAIPAYCRSADAVIAVSQVVKRDIARHTGVDPAKLIPIHNGFDPGCFCVITDTARLQSVRDKYHLPDRFILWAGQIEARKNVARLLRAFAAISHEIPHHLVLAGEHRWSTRQELQVIRELGIESRVRETGWMSHHDLAVLYNLADLFAFPSVYEGFGIPLLEAMACGCPIVTATTCAPPEVTAGAARLVDPQSVDEIAAGMREVLGNEGLRRRIIASGLSRCKDFSWDKCARQVLALFDSLKTRSADATHLHYR